MIWHDLEPSPCLHDLSCAYTPIIWYFYYHLQKTAKGRNFNAGTNKSEKQQQNEKFNQKKGHNTTTS